MLGFVLLRKISIFNNFVLSLSDKTGKYCKRADLFKESKPIARRHYKILLLW